MTVVDGSTMAMLSIEAEVGNYMASCRCHLCRVGGVRRCVVVASKSDSASLVVINGVAGIDHMSVQQAGQDLTGDEVYMILGDEKVAASSFECFGRRDGIWSGRLWSGDRTLPKIDTATLN